MTTYDDYRAKFGEEQADALIVAALGHNNGVHDKDGGDTMLWAILIGSGFECWTKYRDDHGITVTPEEIKDFVAENIDAVKHYTGDVDYLGLFAGAYDWLAELMEEADVTDAS